MMKKNNAGQNNDALIFHFLQLIASDAPFPLSTPPKVGRRNKFLWGYSGGELEKLSITPGNPDRQLLISLPVLIRIPRMIRRSRDKIKN
jgi:hypothetical protein